jgi:hypothetical protein
VLDNVGEKRSLMEMIKKSPIENYWIHNKTSGRI